MRYILGFLLMALCTGLPAQAAPVLKVINFTADWCPNCQILNPRMDEAIETFPEGSIQRVDLDMTDARRGMPMLDVAAVHTDAINLAGEHKAAYLWDWYGGVTGIAVVIAADNGEPITCFMRTLSAEDMEKRLNLAKILAERGTPGKRKPHGPDCPAPMR
ncbi:MAG: thioredoxin family protein [Pseudomonadota bacterium]